MITKARTIAFKAHSTQKYGNQPYSVHLESVAALALTACIGTDCRNSAHFEPGSYGEIAVALAYLHDIVEDTSITLSDIKTEFGDFIADCVALLTDEQGINRKERKAKTYAKMSNIAKNSKYEIVLIVKACDRLANLRSCQTEKNTGLMNMYQKEQHAFKQAAFRPGLCDEIWKQIDSIFGQPNPI